MNPARANILLGILVVLLLIGFLIPWVERLRDEGRRTQTINNVKELTLALHSCNDVQRRLPPIFDKFASITRPTSFHVHLLPYIEEGALHSLFVGSGNGPTDVSVRCFQSPLDNTPVIRDGIQNFAANLRAFSDKGVITRWDENMPQLDHIESGSSAIPRTFTDGTSNTIVFATKYAVCQEGGSQYSADPVSKFAGFFGQNIGKVPAHPSNPEAIFQRAPSASDCLCEPLMAQSFRRSGMAVGLADGSVRTITPKLSPSIWNLALQPNDGIAMR